MNVTKIHKHRLFLDGYMSSTLPYNTPLSPRFAFLFIFSETRNLVSLLHGEVYNPVITIGATISRPFTVYNVAYFIKPLLYYISHYK
jgi:hypothetical protein